MTMTVDLIAEKINQSVPFHEWDIHSQVLIKLAVEPCLIAPANKGYDEITRQAINLIRRLIPTAGPARFPDLFKLTVMDRLLELPEADINAIRASLYSKINPWTFAP